MLVEPCHDALNVEATLLEKRDRLSQRVITGRCVFTIQMVEEIAQILLRHRDRRDEPGLLLLLPGLLQVVIA